MSGITPTIKCHIMELTPQMIAAMFATMKASSRPLIEALSAHSVKTETWQMSVTRRVCGYLGQPNSRPFIKGKQEEVIRRVKHL